MGASTQRGGGELVRAMMDFSPAGVFKLLIAIAAALLAIDLVLQSYHYLVGEVHWLLKDAFDVDAEENFPTWFSSMILLFSAFLLFTIANAKRHSGEKGSGYWRGLAFGFVFLSLDEVAGIHETFNTWADEIRGDSEFSWAYFGAAIIGIVGLIFVRFLATLPARFRKLFYVSGAIYAAGVVGAEIASNLYLKVNHIDSLGYNLWAAFEEGLEMAGIILFIWVLLSYMKTIPQLVVPPSES